MKSNPHEAVTFSFGANCASAILMAEMGNLEHCWELQSEGIQGSSRLGRSQSAGGGYIDRVLLSFVVDQFIMLRAPTFWTS